MKDEEEFMRLVKEKLLVLNERLCSKLATEEDICKKEEEKIFEFLMREMKEGEELIKIDGNLEGLFGEKGKNI